MVVDAGVELFREDMVVVSRLLPPSEVRIAAGAMRSDVVCVRFRVFVLSPSTELNRRDGGDQSFVSTL